MLMNVRFKLIIVTLMLNVLTQMVHTYVFAIWDTFGMVLTAQVSGV